jgi:hypothetical protein
MPPAAVRLLAPALVLAAAAPLRAQEDYWPDRPALSVSAGVSQFDLSGTGSSAMAAVRLERALMRALVLEGGVSVARPAQQFGATTTLVIPEVALQLQLPRLVAPYLGLGFGDAMDFRPESVGGLRHNATVSVAGGVRLWLGDRMGLRGELRVRGIGSTLGGSTAEWTGGAALRF